MEQQGVLGSIEIVGAVGNSLVADMAGSKVWMG